MPRTRPRRPALPEGRGTQSSSRQAPPAQPDQAQSSSPPPPSREERPSQITFGLFYLLTREGFQLARVAGVAAVPIAGSNVLDPLSIQNDDSRLESRNLHLVWRMSRGGPSVTRGGGAQDGALPHSANPYGSRTACFLVRNSLRRAAGHPPGSTRMKPDVACPARGGLPAFTHRSIAA